MADRTAASTNANDLRATVQHRVMTGSKQQCRPELLRLARAGVKATCRNGGVWVAQDDAQRAEAICWPR